MREPTSRPTFAAAWWTLALLSGLNLLNYLDRYIMAAVLTPMQGDLHFNDNAAGWASSAFMLGYFITAPLFGYLGDRFPRKYLMLAGVIIWSLATAASGLAQGFAQLFAIRMVVGVGEACFVTMGPSWISDCFAATRRNTALTLFYIAIPVGSAIGFTVGGWFAERGDWRGAFLYAGVAGVLLALSLLLLREPRRGAADFDAGTNVPPARWSDIVGLMRNGRYNLLIWGYAAQTFSMGAFANWAPTFLHRVHGMSLGHSGEIFGATAAITGLGGTLLGGMLGTVLRRRTPAGYVWVLALSLVSAMPVCFFALMVGNATLSLAGLGASMFLLFLPTGPIASEMFEVVPVHVRASAMALCTFVIHLFGDFGSPALVGYLSTRWDGLQKAVLVLPVMLAIGAAFWWGLLALTPKAHEVEA